MTVTDTGVDPPVSSVVAAVEVPRTVVKVVCAIAAAAELSVDTWTVMNVLLGGLSVKLSVTDETGTPSASAIVCAIAVRSAEEMDDDSPDSVTVVSTMLEADPVAVIGIDTATIDVSPVQAVDSCLP